MPAAACDKIHYKEKAMNGLQSIRDMGRTGLKVSAIGLGCWQFSRNQGLGGKYWSYVEQDQVDEIVSLSLAGGINWFDTAEAYGGGESERALSRTLKNLGRKPGQVVIATKWMPFLRRASSIAKTIDVRLKNLDGYPIDLYQIHNPFSFSRVETEMAAMAELVRQEKIRYVGVSNFSASRMRRAAAKTASCSRRWYSR
jgi:aryl-alcohol dehydrogenase-like predicted oxidoreductase